jgi:putative addiction module killer protein
MEAQPREIRNYITPDGKEPFAEWLDSLRDLRVRVKIEKRLEQVALGNLGNYRTVGEGVCEFKINYGAGYRVYFGQTGSTIILLLCGGDKSTQQQDILKARKYWRDYERSENANE